MNLERLREEGHRLSRGDAVIRLRWIDRGVERTHLYLYGTAASFTRSGLERDGFEVEQDAIAWDGESYVCTYNGD